MKELLFESAGIPTRHHFDRFEAAAKGEKIRWAHLLKGFQSSLDFPACLFWKEQMQAFPKAKVTLDEFGLEHFQTKTAGSLDTVCWWYPPCLIWSPPWFAAHEQTTRVNALPDVTCKRND
eukprot:4690836-Pyramimonas_sp.AAC.1